MLGENANVMGKTHTPWKSANVRGKMNVKGKTQMLRAKRKCYGKNTNVKQILCNVGCPAPDGNHVKQILCNVGCPAPDGKTGVNDHVSKKSDILKIQCNKHPGVRALGCISSLFSSNCTSNSFKIMSGNPLGLEI